MPMTLDIDNFTKKELNPENINYDTSQEYHKSDKFY